MPRINKTKDRTSPTPAAPDTPDALRDTRHADRTGRTDRVGRADRRARSAAAWPLLRVAITVFFALDGFLFAGWVVRIPAIKEQVHASPGLLGLALLCVSGGAVLSMTPAGRLCLRHGPYVVTIGSVALTAASLTLPAQAHSVPALGGALLLFGAGYGAANVGINSAAVEFVAAVDRPVMPAFHAAYSLGGLIGSTTGGLLTSVLTPAQYLGAMAVFGLAVAAWGGTALMRSRPAAAIAPAASAAAAASAEDGAKAAAAAAAKATAARGTGLLVLLLGVVALCDAYGEGSLADWGTLHLTQDVHTSSALAAAGFAAYSLAMTSGRISGTRLVERFGPAPVMTVGAGIACVGMLVAALSTVLPLVLFGFLLVGIGLSNIFPLAIDRAGALNGPKGVATASTLGYGGMVLGPPLIGFLAQALGLPHALLSVALLTGLAGVATVAVQRATARLAPESAPTASTAPAAPAVQAAAAADPSIRSGN